MPRRHAIHAATCRHAMLLPLLPPYAIACFRQFFIRCRCRHATLLLPMLFAVRLSRFIGYEIKTYAATPRHIRYAMLPDIEYARDEENGDDEALRHDIDTTDHMMLFTRLRCYADY